MKYSTEIVINKPIGEVIAKFDSIENLKHWQPGLQSFETISGAPGQVGSKARLKFKTPRGDMEMIETITVRNLPEEFSGTYEVQGVFNVVKNKFFVIDANTTKLVTENEFQFNGWVMKLIGFLMPGMFKKTTMSYAKNFKDFVETGKSILDSK